MAWLLAALLAWLAALLAALLTLLAGLLLAAALLLTGLRVGLLLLIPVRILVWILFLVLLAHHRAPWDGPPPQACKASIASVHCTTQGGLVVELTPNRDGGTGSRIQFKLIGSRGEPIGAYTCL